MLTALFSMQLELTKEWGKRIANRLNDQHCNKACRGSLISTLGSMDNSCGDKGGVESGVRVCGQGWVFCCPCAHKRTHTLYRLWHIDIVSEPLASSRLLLLLHPFSWFLIGFKLESLCRCLGKRTVTAISNSGMGQWTSDFDPVYIHTHKKSYCSTLHCTFLP